MKRIREFADGLSSLVVSLVANIAPWLAPLPTAWLIYEKTMLHLGWPKVVAAIAALTLEALGVAITATALELYNYNGSKRKADPVAPVWVALSLAVFYLGSALALVVLLDIAPGVAVYTQAIYPVLSVVGAVLIALRAGHERRVSEIKRSKAEVRAKRAERKAKQAKEVATPEFANKKQHIVYLLDNEPHLLQSEIAARVGAAASYVSEVKAGRNGSSIHANVEAR